MNTVVILPARNEEQVIGKMVKMTLAVYPDYIKKIIVVNDGSTDETKKIVEAIARQDKRVKLINRRPPHGVGLAIREGLKHVSAEFDYVFTLDADFIRNISDLEEFFHKIPNYDGLIGSRYMEKNSLIRYPALKRVFNRLFHAIAKYLFNIRHTDLTNNFKLYKREVFQSIHLQADDYAINAETGLYPILLGYNIGELPVTWYARSRNMGHSKFHLLSVAPGYIKVLQRAVFQYPQNNTVVKVFRKLTRQKDKADV